MYSRTETQWWSPANVSSQRVAGLTGREGFACHEPATLSYYTSPPVFVTSVYRYVALLNMRQPPLSFIIHYSAVFIAPIGYYRICIYIYSISISRVSTTYFHDAGIREVEGKEMEKRKKRRRIVSGNFNGWKPNFFFSFIFPFSSRASLFHSC